MSTIKNLLEHIPVREVLTISPPDSVYDAIALMSKQNVGALPVMQGDQIVGIVTERDYARKIILRNRASRTTQVSEIMSKEVIYVTTKDSAEACMALMVLKQVGHLPVLEDGKLSGFISMGDLARIIISDHENLIDQLTNYVYGDRLTIEHPEREAALERRVTSHPKPVKDRAG
jgi:IMP dehydrogenase